MQFYQEYSAKNPTSYVHAVLMDSHFQPLTYKKKNFLEEVYFSFFV